MRRTLTSLLVLVLAGFGLLLAPSAASASPYCGQVWGSLPKSAAGFPTGEVTNVRAGRHTCYDRLVLDIDAPLRGWSVQYVSVVTHDPSGMPVPVAGGARLQVTVQAGVVATDSWFTSSGALVNTAGYRTFRDVRFAGSFESVTTFGLGVRARLPFRAFVLAGRARARASSSTSGTSGARPGRPAEHRDAGPGDACRSGPRLAEWTREPLSETA